MQTIKSFIIPLIITLCISLIAGCKKRQPKKNQAGQFVKVIAVESVAPEKGYPTFGKIVPAFGRTKYKFSPNASTEFDLNVDVPPEILSAVPLRSEVKVKLPLTNSVPVSGIVLSKSENRLLVRFRFQGRSIDESGAEVLFPPYIKSKFFALPIGSVIGPEGKNPYVFKIQDGKAIKLKIEPQGIYENKALVSGPFQRGDEIAVEGMENLADGEDVRVLK
ncbi:hypothetical protein EHQ53_16225 [Leptospira langatensis]|uniref:Efflux RND transporter periplasmic adaptor subunit n=1 Tax=Leptospira langatensis TaxID=2484983 RepID=A0A5F1ZN47_9LEPT|nr:efflux RND transporter periplasmic adaptor subunit [Leptospira langatensis]TGK05191.1 hypothetical protein EHO57_00470 [Leptospira langatensis]TGL38327.1 hypothetical protein EHQ53_16225 [Leptospira langatensis]